MLVIHSNINLFYRYDEKPRIFFLWLNDKNIYGDDDDPENQWDELGETHVAFDEEIELKEPPKYAVVMLNDDYTPMGFVVDALCKFFNMSEEKATQIMLLVHQKGQAVCGIYPKDIAETKAYDVCEYAKSHEHPLLCKIRAVD